MTTRRPLVPMLALALLGCGDTPVGPGPEPEPINPVGAYVLVALDGRPLPADTRSHGDCKTSGDYCATAGTLTIDPGGTYALHYDWWRPYYDGSVNQSGRYGEAGRWVATSDSITLSPSDGRPAYRGTMPSSAELEVLNGNKFTFKK